MMPTLPQIARVLFAGIAVGLVGCAPAVHEPKLELPADWPALPQAVAASVADPQRPPAYFTDELLNGAGVNRTTWEKVAAHLRALQEPSLIDPANRVTEAYRVLLLPSFNHSILVRAVRDRSGGGGILIVNYAGWYGDLRGVASTAIARLSEPQWAEVESQVASSGFLSTSPGGATEMIDGTMWLVESFRAGEHHVALRHSPRNGPVRKVALHVLALAGPEAVRGMTL